MFCKKLVIFFVFVSLFLFTLNQSNSFGIDYVKQDWLNIQDGPVHGYDILMDLAAYGTSGVVITAFVEANSRDYITIRYDAEGNILWRNYYDGPDGLLDQPYALFLDTAGNAYVTGISHSENEMSDFATIKYDSAGNELWVTRYDSPVHQQEDCRSITADGLGNVYVTGASRRAPDSPGQDDCMTVKYDSEGNELWTARYGFTDPTRYAFCLHVRTDPSGNIYVGGGHGTIDSNGLHLDSNYLVIKYDTNGNEIWNQAPDTGPGVDQVRSMEVDEDGNVYAGGQDCSDWVWGSDFRTMKFDTDGNLLWTTWYDGPGNEEDRIFDLAIDDEKNVYVTGPSEEVIYDTWYGTIKYDPDGNELWVARYDSPVHDNTNLEDDSYEIGVDAGGNVYVTGRSWGGWDLTKVDMATIKYDPEGNQIWVMRFDREPFGWEQGNHLGLDEDGNVYVGGRSLVDHNTDIALVKYKQCNGCMIDDVFYCEGDKDPENPCLVCSPETSESAWSDNNGATCDEDGIFCNGTEFCQGSTCTGHTGDPCSANETCDEQEDSCISLTDDDDDDDDNDDNDTDDDDDNDNDDNDDDNDDIDDDDNDDNDVTDDDIEDPTGSGDNLSYATGDSGDIGGCGC